MKHFLCLFLAASSALLLAWPARTARRPRYGGTLRFEIAAQVNSLDPATAPASAEAAFARDQLRALVGSPEGGANAPFRLTEWEPGKLAMLTANDSYAGGRPFVDAIEIRLGRPAKDRLLDLELGTVDLTEIPAEEARRAAEQGVRLSASQPDELVALVFLSGRPLVDDSRLRESVARAIDRRSIASFILQKEGEPAGGLLPQWSSGTAFLFPTAADPAKEQGGGNAQSFKFVLGYDAGDRLEQAIGERVAVNAHEAGVSMVIRALGSPEAAATPDARLMRLHMASPRPGEALAGFLASLAPLTGIEAATLPSPASPERIYGLERSIVDSYRVIPLVWLPQVYGLGSHLRDWRVPGPGENWPLAQVWLDPADLVGTK